MSFPSNTWGSSGFPFISDSGFPSIRNKLADALALIQAELDSDPTIRTGLFHTLDLSDLYTTSTGETNVVADGDPVGLITNQIGTITATTPISSQRPLYRVTSDGVPYLQFLNTSRVTFNFGTSFRGAMVVSTLDGSYIVEVNTTTTLIWGQYMPVRNVVGISFIEGFDINSSKGAEFREQLNTDTQGQLDWDDERASFFWSFRNLQLTSIPEGLFDNTPNVTRFSFTFWSNGLTSLPEGLFDNTPNVTDFGGTFQGNQLTSIPEGFFDNTPNVTSFMQVFVGNQLTSIPAGLFDNTPNVTDFSFAFFGNQLTSIPAGLFDTQTVCTNYNSCFRGNTLTPQSVENVLVSVNLSATNNNLLNGTLGIAGDNSPLTTNAETARQSLLAKGWNLTLDNITGL